MTVIVYTSAGRAGCVALRRARQTGRQVGVYRNDQAGLDDDEGRAPWSTVCEEHGTIISHSTLRLAKDHAADPLGWCETCRALDDDAESASIEELEAAGTIVDRIAKPYVTEVGSPGGVVARYYYPTFEDLLAGVDYVRALHPGPGRALAFGNENRADVDDNGLTEDERERLV